jgi:hypothetical protein
MYKLFTTASDIPMILKVIENQHTYIPMSEENSDYQAYLRWLEEGNTPLPAEENQ